MSLTEAHEKKDNDRVAELAIMIRVLNRERASVREAINEHLDGQDRGSGKVGYLDVGRDK